MGKRTLTFKYFVYLVAVFSIFTYGQGLFKEILTSNFIDFGHYYVCAHLLREGYDIWQWAPETAAKMTVLCCNLGFKETARPLHSPGYFFLMLPFTFLPYKAAVYLWLLLIHSALLLTVVLILKRVKSNGSFHKG